MDNTGQIRNMSNLVIFDIDGTLMQTTLVTVPAVQRAFAAHGLAQPGREEICAFFGQPVEAYESWLAAQCPPGKADAIVADTNALELRLIGEEGRLYPGTRETLDALRENGYMLAISSNAPDAYVNEFLSAHRLHDYFPVAYARDTRYSGKEEMAGLILETVRPRAFAVVGDRADDIAAAHAWGGFGVAARYGFGNEAEWRGADAVIDAVTQAPACIERLFAGRRL